MPCQFPRLCGIGGFSRSIIHVYSVYVNEKMLFHSVYIRDILVSGGDIMPFRLKFDVLSALKDKGYTTYFLRINHIFSESTIQDIRKGNAPSYSSVAKLCELLECNVGDLIDYVSDGSISIPKPKEKKTK